MGFRSSIASCFARRSCTGRQPISFALLGVVVPALYLLFEIEAVHANVIDAIWYLAPFIAAQSAVFLWLTDGRVLPLMSDLYQMLCTTEVLKVGRLPGF